MENNVPTLQAIKVKGGLPVMLMYPVRERNVPLRIQTALYNSTLTALHPDDVT